MIKKPKKEFIDFDIDAGTYEYSIYCIITEDIERAVKRINWKYELPTKDILEFDLNDLNGRGKVFKRKDYIPIMWIPTIPNTPREYGTLFHELFHCVCNVTKWANVPLGDDSEEAYCHLIGHLTTNFFEKLNQKLKRK